MATVKFLAGFICLAFIGRDWGFGSGIVKQKEDKYERIIKIATKEIGVVERTNQNDGARVTSYLAYVGFKTPQPWCAALVSWVFKEAGYNQPKTAWSPALFPAARQVKEPKSGIIYGLYFPALKRIAHCGFVEFARNDLIYGIEGNTNLAGSREGDGVWRKIRHKRTVSKYADWVK